MTRSELIQAIVAEIDRIWPDGFSGEWGEYEWLEAAYNVTLDDDSDWTGIVNYEAGVLDPDDDPAFLEFAADDSRVIPFLRRLLEKYQSNSVTAPDDIPIITMRVDPVTGETIRRIEGE